MAVLFILREMFKNAEENREDCNKPIYPSPRNDCCKYFVNCFKPFFFNKRKPTNGEYVPIVFPSPITMSMISHVDPFQKHIHMAQD